MAFLASLAAAAAVAAAAAPVHADSVDCKIVVPGYAVIWLRGEASTSGDFHASCHGVLPDGAQAPDRAMQLDVDGWRVSITPGGRVSAIY